MADILVGVGKSRLLEQIDGFVVFLSRFSINQGNGLLAH